MKRRKKAKERSRRKSEREEALAIILDVGWSMNQAAPGHNSDLQAAVTAINMILQRKLFAESKDEMCLVLLGTDNTANDLAEGGSYEHITLARPLAPVDWELLSYLQNDVLPATGQADFLDAIVVAMDHIMKGIQGKRGFATKRIILFSDMAGEFGDDQLDDIIGSLKEQSVEFNVIGPDLEDDEDGPPQPGTSNGHVKQRTSQQRAGETLLRHMLQETNGEAYRFDEAIAALSYFQSRQVKPTAWKCTLDVGSDLQIPINGFIKVKEAKPKSFKNVYARDENAGIQRVRTFHLNDEEETEIEQSDTVEGHRYGSTLVPFSEDDKEAMKFKAQKCFKILGFTKSENLKRNHFMGDYSMAVVAEKQDQAAAVALSALIQALYETNMVAIVRRVYNNASSVKIGCLAPHIKANYECLFYNELPFAEDLRQYTFGSLPLAPDTEGATKKHAPSEEQLSAMDSLIDEMDLTKALRDGDDAEAEEALKPKLTFNPFLQRLYQCMQHRALNPAEALPELSPLIAQYLEPPKEIATQCEGTVDRMTGLFKLEEVTRKKQQKTGDNMFNDGDGDAPAAKKPRVDEDLKGGMAGLVKAKVTEVGTVNPVDDFRTIINQKDEDRFEQACDMMQKRIVQIVMDSFGAQFYSKALDCLKVFREEAIKNSGAKIFNDFLADLKGSLRSKGRVDFWDTIVKVQVTLITKSECESGGVMSDEATAFIATEEVKRDEPPPQAEEDDDDLLDQLE